MTIITDSIQVKNGTDYSFVCGKVPFAISCSSTLTHGAYNLIDLDLVNKMKIPLQKIKVCRMTYLGENMRSVGYIDQTVQCVQNGIVQGTIHLSAKVVRSLFDNFNVDCIASSKTYEKLTGDKPPDPPDMDAENTEENYKEDVQDKFPNDCHGNISCGSTSSSTCSDAIPAISREWIRQASFMAEVAQQDSEDTLLRLENEKANVKNDDDSDDVSEEDEDDNKHDNTQTETEEDEEPDEWSEYPDFHCDLCFRMGQPVKIVTNHSNECPTCPSLTIKQKEALFGTHWKERAEKIFRNRFKRDQKRRKSSADQ